MIEYLTTLAIYAAFAVTAASLFFRRPKGSLGIGGGGSSGGGGTQRTVTESKNEPPAFVKPFSERLLERSQTLSETFGEEPLPTGAERIVPFSPEEELAFGLTTQRALAGSPETQAARQGIISMLGPDAGFDPVTNRLVDRAQGNIVDQFNLNVAPSTSARFQQGGILGGTAQQELESAQRFSLARALGDTEAGIRSDALGRTLSAAQLAPALAEEDFRNIAALESVGTQRRGLGQLVRDIDIQNQLQARERPLRQLDILGSAINVAGGGFSNQTGTTTTTGVPSNRGNPFISALGAGGSFLGGVGSLVSAFSSKTFKHDDGRPERILDRVKRLPVRTWRYKWDPSLHIGPYAEDFHELFGLGDGRMIPVVDAMGILFQSVKELAEQVDTLEAAHG